jgi:hypothetical protein
VCSFLFRMILAGFYGVAPLDDLVAVEKVPLGELPGTSEDWSAVVGDTEELRAWTLTSDRLVVYDPKWTPDCLTGRKSPARAAVSHGFREARYDTFAIAWEQIRRLDVPVRSPLPGALVGGLAGFSVTYFAMTGNGSECVGCGGIAYVWLVAAGVGVAVGAIVGWPGWSRVYELESRHWNRKCLEKVACQMN